MLTGLDRLCLALRSGERPRELTDALWRALRGRVGLVTHAAAITAEYVAAPDALKAAGAGLARLFGPEHGLRGDAAEGAKIDTTTDARTGLEVVSLYGSRRAPAPEHLSDLDLLLVDFQDVGARFYTYQSTLTLVMEACRGRVPVVVLDRPNPVGGAAVEGPLLVPELASFVGQHPVPVRHGLTLGEFALHCHRRFGVGEVPTVLRAEGWRREQLWREDWAWAPPSPNIPTPRTTLLYLATCFVEGTSLSEGRGTALPFHQVGGPEVDAYALADRFNAGGAPGVRARPAWFRPTTSKHAGQVCAGVMLHVTDPAVFRPVRAGVRLLCGLRDAVGPAWSWIEYAGVKFVDRLFGTPAVRERIVAGATADEVCEGWDATEAAFTRERQPALLYR
jgi:uncharacterized protein YbbC (DUF1343 family)